MKVEMAKTTQSRSEPPTAQSLRGGTQAHGRQAQVSECVEGERLQFSHGLQQHGHNFERVLHRVALG